MAAAPVDLVNPLQGSDSHFGYSQGNTYPNIVRPFGMTAWAPQTDDSSGWFYSFKDRKLQGIRATHQPSPWINDFGHFVLSPQTRQVSVSGGDRASAFSRAQEVATPYSYSATLMRYQTRVEVTPTTRCAHFRIEFPAGERAFVLLQPFDGASSVTVSAEEGSVVGFTSANSGGVPSNFRAHYRAVFDVPVLAGGSGVTRGNDKIEGEFSLEGARCGAYVELDTSASGGVVHVAVGTSFLSAEQAAESMRREIGTKTHDELVAEARAEWEQALGRIVVEGGSEKQRRTFYSCLYRVHTFPHKFYEINADGEQVHYSPYDGETYPGIMYEGNGFWDTHRTVYALLTIIAPRQCEEILAGWLNAYKEGGWLPKWSSPGYRDSMVGTFLNNILADAFLKGLDIDAPLALEASLQDGTQVGARSGAYGRVGIEYYMAKGYVPSDVGVDGAVSRTLDFAYNDFGIGQLGTALGRDVDMIVPRITNYTKLYDAETGFMRPKLDSGEFVTPFYPDEWGGPYVEGSAWQFSWSAPHDGAGLVALMGGADKFCAKLDEMVEMDPPTYRVGGYGFEIHEITEMALGGFGQNAHSNQPVHHLMYMYIFGGQAYKTQRYVRRVLDEMYSPEADGFAGDEDNGEMSAWYVLSALGFYPVTIGHPSYSLGSPLFPRAVVSLRDGEGTFVVESSNNSADNVYVQKTQLNGATHNKAWISHADLVAGNTTLSFDMGAAPVTEPAQDDDYMPYSYSTHGFSKGAKKLGIRIRV